MGANELDWSDLKYFLAALEAGSLSGGAEALGVAQATMSRRVAGLEEQIGHGLFDRSRGGLTPTEAAVLLRPHAEAVAEAVAEAEAALSGLEARPAGVVRLAVPPGLAVDVVPMVVQQLKHVAPDLRLEVLADNRYVDLARREAEIAIRRLPPESGDLVFRRLPDVPLAAFVSPAYCAALHARRGPDAGPLRGEEIDWIQYSPELLHTPPAQWVEHHRGDRPAAYTSNNFLAMRAAAAADVGAMLLPVPQGEAAGLVPLEGLNVELPDVRWYLVVHRALRRVPRIVAVLDVLDEIVRSISDGHWPSSVEQASAP